MKRTLPLSSFVPSGYSNRTLVVLAILVVVVPNLDPSEIEAMERGELTREPHGTPYVFDRAFRLLGEVPN